MVDPLYEEDYKFTYWFIDKYGENPVLCSTSEPRKVQEIYEAFNAGFLQGREEI